MIDLEPLLGKADWMYDKELGVHLPVCSMESGHFRCGKGPLPPEKIVTGDCGEAHLVIG